MCSICCLLYRGYRKPAQPVPGDCGYQLHAHQLVISHPKTSEVYNIDINCYLKFSDPITSHLDIDINCYLKFSDPITSHLVVEFSSVRIAFNSSFYVVKFHSFYKGTRFTTFCV